MICVIDTFVIYHIYCSKPLHQSVITLPSFTTSKTDNLLFLGSFQNTSEHILKPLLCAVSLFLRVFDHKQQQQQQPEQKQACASIVAIVPISASARATLHPLICIFMFCTDIICLPFGQGRPFFLHSFR